MTIFEKYERAKNLNKNLRKIASDAVYKTRDEFLDLNKQQMTAGYDSEQQRIGVYAWDSYERMKQKMFPQSGGWMNFRLTGSFQEGMVLEVDSVKWKVFSRDGKEAKLLGIAGNNGRRIYGLAPNQMKDYRALYFMPELRWQANRELNG